MTPDNIGRIIIIAMSIFVAGLFIWALCSTGAKQSPHRILMWIGFITLCCGNVARNLASGQWLDEWWIFPGMGGQITGLVCLGVGCVMHLRENSDAERLARIRRAIDAEIGHPK